MEATLLAGGVGCGGVHASPHLLPFVCVSVALGALVLARVRVADAGAASCGGYFL